MRWGCIRDRSILSGFSLLEVGEAYGVVEHAGPICSIFIECFVHNIPCVALPFEVRDFIRDMVLHRSNERRIRPCPRSD